jgi:ADP-heptose:LPS heptosyltransferase
MKEITFGIPNGGSLGDLLTLNPVMRLNKNSTIQFAPSKRAFELAELFLGICKVQFVNENELIYDVQALKNHGFPERRNPHEHATINFLNMFDYQTNDLLPKINLYDFDIQFAKNFLTKYKNPICINMLCGNYKDKTDILTQTRMLSFDFWQDLVSILKRKGYDVLHFGFKDDIIEDIVDVDYINGLSLRETSACLHHIKNVISIDSGLYHLSLASGANVYCLHPPNGLGYLAQNYHYDERFWTLENKRVFYDCFNGNFDNLKRLVNSI